MKFKVKPSTRSVSSKPGKITYGNFEDQVRSSRVRMSRRKIDVESLKNMISLLGLFLCLGLFVVEFSELDLVAISFFVSCNRTTEYGKFDF